MIVHVGGAVTSNSSYRSSGTSSLPENEIAYAIIDQMNKRLIKL